LKATHAGNLKIGEIEIPCFVLENKKRVVSHNGLIIALGMSDGGAKGPRAKLGRLGQFLTQKSLKMHISPDLTNRGLSPVSFSWGGQSRSGFEATVLADICEAVLDANDAGVTLMQHRHIVQRCSKLIRAFARVGIIALVDDAAGYTAERDQGELHRFLALYLSGERLAWAKRFPDEYYEQIYRLMGWGQRDGKKNPPQYVGKLTNRWVYDKLPPGVLDELRKRNPVISDSGARASCHHQLLSPTIGLPDLDKHLLQVLALMRASKDVEEFEVLLSSFMGHRKMLQTSMF
jgi:hypothetical protein